MKEKKRLISMMWVIAMLLVAVLLVPVHAESRDIYVGVDMESSEAVLQADVSGTCGLEGDNLKWALSGDTLTISGTGKMADYSYRSHDPDWNWNDQNLPWCDYKNDIKKIVIKNGVENIGNYAFYFCDLIITITLPESLTSIGEGAFAYCSSLTSITLPGSVTSIGEEAFDHCSSLTSITLPESVTSIGESAFSSCSSLTSITLPENVTSIGRHTFRNCSSLTSITLPGSVTSIGESAFAHCSSLTSITLPENVTSIGESAFCYCDSITTITLPESLTSIGVGAFSNCNSLASITLPGSVTSIGEKAFAHCSLLTGIALPESLTSIGRGAFWNCSSLTSITLPESLMSIGGGGAFNNCSSLTSITLPEGMRSIEDSTFYDCSSLTSITLPESLRSIGVYAFCDCSSLTDIYYRGSEEQWDEIHIRSRNAELYHADIHYDYNDTPIPGKKLNGVFVGELGDNGEFDGYTYEWGDGCYTAFAANELGNCVLSGDKKIVYKIENGKVTKFARLKTVINPGIKIDAFPDTFIYQNGKYNQEKLTITISVYLKRNLKCPFYDYELRGVEGLELTIKRIEYSTTSDIINFGKKGLVFQRVLTEQYDKDVKLTYGDEVSITHDIYVNDEIVPEKVNTVEYIKGTMYDENNDIIDGIGDQASITIGNLDKQKQLSKERDNSSLYKTELEKLRKELGVNSAILISPSLDAVFTPAQIDQIEQFLTIYFSHIINSSAYAKRGFFETLTAKIQDRIEDRLLNMLGVEKNGILTSKSTSFRVRVKGTAKTGKDVTVEFYGRIDDYISGKDIPFGSYVQFKHKIINMDAVPKETSQTGDGGAAFYNMTSFANIMLSFIKAGYSDAWGSNADQIASMIISKPINELLFNGTFSGELYDFTANTVKNSTKKHSIYCPVDVYVYDDNDVVCGSIVDDQIVTSSDEVVLTVCGDKKYIYTAGGNYKLKLCGTGEGSLDYIVEEYFDDEIIRTMKIENVPLDGSTSYTTVITDIALADYNILSLYNEETDTSYVATYDSYDAGVDMEHYEIENFVARLYRNFLGREYDASGLKAWTDALTNNEITGAKVVYKFVYSEEFQANPLNNTAFVTAMYETILGREPDADGLDAWVKVLENGCTRKKVLVGFLNSEEMRELCSSIGIEAGSYYSDEIVDKNTKVTYFVSRMYRCCLGREADYDGLTSWVSALLDGRATGTKIADGFFFSDEMKNMGLSNRDYVTNAYVALLDRQPDADGLSAWTDALDKGTDRKKIVKGFVGSQEFGNLCAEYGITR